MTNRIRNVVIQDLRLDPVEAEVRVTVHLDQPARAEEIRGRLVGPRCTRASTLEVSHAFMPVPTTDAAAASPTWIYRVVIPEPSLWDPERPFLYEALVELRAGDTRLQPVTSSHGLRTFVLGQHGLRWNGEPVTLRGVRRTRLTPADAATLRQAGYNTILAPCPVDTVWEAADRWGFLVLGTVTTLADLAALEKRRHHACHLGMLLAPAVWQALSGNFSGLPGLVGIELEAALPNRLPPGVAFAAGPEALLPERADLAWPSLLLGAAAMPDRSARSLGVVLPEEQELPLRE